ncbi:MAG: hypothetical protein ACI37O_06415 [Candidatus Avelusimicrobium sp.]|uniref:hypothetical protein n=1 Tax=Candidatus Avelusimicrobium sp. TaxID=3048833 RepID=UPI003F019CCB
MKHINIISAAVLCGVGLAVLTEPLQAQAVKAPVVAARSAGKAAQTVLGSGISGLPYYCSLRNLPASARGKFIPVLPASLSAAQANAVNRVVLQAKQERAVRSRLFLSAGTRLHREEILKGYHLPLNYIEGYYFRRIQPYLATPRYTPDGDKDILFRGMLLTPEELSEVMRKGFSPSTSTWNTGTDGRAAVSFSSSSVEAAHYIFQQGFKKNTIGVVFEVRRSPAMVPGLSRLYNSTKTIYYSYEDIAPENIVDVLVWGEYGLERLEDIIHKAARGEIRPHTNWTGQFDGLFR